MITCGEHPETCDACGDKPIRVVTARSATLCQKCDAAGTTKRIARYNRVNREDILGRRYAEMRAAINERDRYRREAQSVKDGLRSEVRQEEVERLRRLPFWRRMRILFSPWSSKWEPTCPR